MAVSSGKWYAEFTATSLGGTYPQIGIVDITQWSADSQPGANSRGWGYLSDGRIFNNNSAIDTGEATYTTGDVIGVAVDLTNNKVYFSKNGTFINSADPAAGTNGYSITAGYDYAFSMSSYDAGTDPVYNLNFGQQPFTYTPPTGFVRLNTFNLPTPTIGATASTTANKYFNAITYTGNGAASSNTTQNITTTFYPDLTWVKGRDSAFYHRLTSTGLTQPNYLSTNSTDTEGTLNDQISALASTYFQVKAAGTGGTNQSGLLYVGWAWNANSGSTVTNTNGSIISSVSVNTTAGFSIVTYTGNGANSTVGHGLGVTPAMVIVKRRSGTQDWPVWHQNLSGGQYVLYLNLTAAEQIANITFQGAPTSTVLQVGTSSEANGSSQTYVAYCFAPVAGYSAFGSYTGNGSSDGTFVYMGFRPKYIMTKKSSGTEDWAIIDTSRSTYNIQGADLYANLAIAEGTSGYDILSNGIKFRSSGGSWNASGATYIYMAFAENPFKYANAR